MSLLPVPSLPDVHILTLLQTPETVPLHPVPWTIRAFDYRIQAGFPSPAADYIETALDLNDYLIPQKASTFLFTVAGLSMINAGILDGDKVAANRAIEPRHWHIVVAIVNEEYTIKRLIRKTGRIELHAENPSFRPLVFQGEDELRIFGVVTGVLRRLQV